MNTKTIYNKINKYLESGNLELIQEIKKELEIDIITNGKVNRGIISTWKQFVKAVDPRNTFKQVFKSSSGNYVICNGFYAIDYGTSTDYIPKELHPYIECVEHDPINIDYDKLKLNEAEGIQEYTIRIEDLEKMHNFNKIHDERIPYKVHNKYINADLLLEILTFMNIKKVESIPVYMSESPLAPMEIRLNNINSILLPIRVEGERSERIEEVLKELYGDPDTQKLDQEIEEDARLDQEHEEELASDYAVASNDYLPF